MIDLKTVEPKVMNGIGINRDEALELSIQEDVTTVFPLTNRVRNRFFGTRVSLCGIINARSGNCSEDCRFCAQSSHYRTEANQFSLLPSTDIVSKGHELFDSGARGFSIVASGQKAPENGGLRKVGEAVTGLSGRGYLCASLGLLQLKQAKFLKDAGLKRYHHNLETARNFFPEICSTHSFQDRVITIQTAKAAGLEVCSGGIFGIGESWQDRIDLAYELKELQVESIPLNFLCPIPGTPMEQQAPLPSLECLHIIALFRLINPAVNLTVCGGRERNLRDLQSWIFMAGASGMMIGNYLTTTGRSIDDDLGMLKDLGLKY